jgi:DNA-binding beta-propeller fold protein YncE
VETITNKDIVGPWDLAVATSRTKASQFISNALGGNTSTDLGAPFEGYCTVVRLDFALSPTSPPHLTSSTVIGKEYPWQANSAALVLAPTGLALGANSTLYVDDSQTNTISAIPNALARSTAITASAGKLTSGGGLDAPLGMMVAPDGDLIVVNGNDGNAVEVTPRGKQVATTTLVKNGAGDLFGLAIAPGDDGILFVNDGTNALDLLHT